MTNLRPAEYRADLVLFLLQASRKMLGVIVEVQLTCDEDKSYTWPVYIANLRARHRCPVCLLVITIEDSVSRWAAKSIELGPGTQCNPWVVGPSNTPVFSDLQQAKENVELAVLSAIEQMLAVQTRRSWSRHDVWPHVAIAREISIRLLSIFCVETPRTVD